ncbi:hypothetical protein D3C87_2096600 [compost metagenome]
MIRSPNVWLLLSAETAKAMGAKTKADTGCKSSAGSNGSFLKMYGSREYVVSLATSV